jgi:hypothetical protein
MFAGYGLMRADIVAVLTAVVALLLFQAWSFARDLSRLETVRSLGEKIVAHERAA